MNITCLPPCRLRAACLRASADNNSASAHAWSGLVGRSRLPVEPRALRLACSLPSLVGRRRAAGLDSRGGRAWNCRSKRGTRKDRRRRRDRDLLRAGKGNWRLEFWSNCTLASNVYYTCIPGVGALRIGGPGRPPRSPPSRAGPVWN